MKKYNVEIIETLNRIVEVEADSYEDAEDKVQNMYDNEEIVLDWNDCEDVNYKQYPSPKIKDDININIEYSKNDNNVVISSENFTSSSYTCRDMNDLINSINVYIDNYVENEKEENIDMER